MAKGSGNNRTVSSTTATASRISTTGTSNSAVFNVREAMNSYNNPLEIVVLYNMAKTFNKSGSITNADLNKIEKAAKDRIKEVEHSQISNISSLKIPENGATTKVPIGGSDAYVMHFQENSNRGYFRTSLPNGRERNYYYDKLTNRNKREAWKLTKDFMKVEVRNSKYRIDEMFRKYKKS